MGVFNERSPHRGRHEVERSTASSDDGYWEALLEQGEVASADAPPPWASLWASHDHRGDDSHDLGDWDEQLDWARAYELMEQHECCQVAVTGHNRGGLLVAFGNLCGFVPSSHLVDFPSYIHLADREQALAQRIGQELKVQVIEIDRPRRRLVLSERAACAGANSASVFARLTVGDVVSGRVSNLRRFGAFVDLGGFEGLIHISELSWGRVNDPGDIVQPGDVVEVVVLDLNREENKIQLSLKQLQSDPWREIAQRYQIGQFVFGEVTNVVDFGAFTRLEDGVEGLIHISELAEGTFLHPRNVVREGQRVEVRVLSIDPHNRRIGLSLRQAHTSRLAGAAADEVNLVGRV